MRFYCESAQAVLREKESASGGLTGQEAADRLERVGKNKLKDAKKDSIIKRFLLQLADPMIIILMAAALVSGVTSTIAGDGFAEVIIILAVVVINSILGVYQESKAEKAIEALQEMAAATSKVLRDGRILVTHSEDLVPGDIVMLEAGDAVPADGRLIESVNLKIEESALTGESVPVSKDIQALALGAAADIPLGDRKNMVYMGSTVVYGRGVAVITDTGMATEMGKIADALAESKEGQTPLQLRLSQLSKILSLLVLGICAIIFLLGILREGSINTKSILDTFMIAVSLAVAAIPEGLAAVVTIVLSIGVTNMSKRNAIIRKLTAVETLGCAQIICSDKTGTLTQNKMTVVERFGRDEELLAKAMALCSDAQLDKSGQAAGEPTEAALVNYALSLNMNKDDLKEKEPRIGEAPFDSARKMMSTVHRGPDGLVQYTKGAPDVVLGLCTHYLKDGEALPMTDEMLQEIARANKDMASRALRVLSAATRRHHREPEEYTPRVLERELCFIGLVGMIDPIRPEARDAIHRCRQSGIRPIMITGDHIDTAVAIAKELDILDDMSGAITGSALGDMGDEEYKARYWEFCVYARVQPEHKVRIVNAWKAGGCVTAMTGDGVNDAPSIKAADIGIGMGITGTDVTKSVADMVLADDNFATIVGAVEEGRRIYANIRKAIQFLLGSNMSEVLSILAATLIGFIILKPVHLLWINLVTDSLPALALGMESAEPDIMSRKPRNPRDGIFAGGMGPDILYQGTMIALLTLAAYFIGHFFDQGFWGATNSEHGITMAFLTMSMAEICHSFNMRSQRNSLFAMETKNKTLILAALGSLISTTLVIYLPFLSEAFGFSHISAVEYGISLVLALCTIPIVETVKYFQRRLKKEE